ncbi:PREDICTED: uncharacterized protein LOC105448455 [Wasmannia auropunctata]|uniref:uncharacterized protein LOC105448455 n=1 Tax=Wasmannia auropunctata TaxID=64793 RepID=UPI0005EDED3A|nr:PREDICTED: uncharacterized protein LOC105448455 [Wasmannia auropunctata]XP_011685305.1 PREDICTED: uncharacterized protein LOC105448455 [Wasmannia auropunctata]XP_011685306.1 PREDICTED: uncharacterized protein LOC105448455 [Wasmannia auropunctata]XP_011685307.1 PREDICTED: uncharacterized protein LOC105448455 [Wasmannia auropunctata]XP_011685308.1 PREDICTED: uncharacterized protein LOC105448455 [Wasmannia auropunctata]
MQELAFPRRKGILAPVSVLVLLILPLVDLPSANGACEFPSNWSGEWYLYGKNGVFINTTVLGDRTCVERTDDKYVVYFSGENCYHCMIINGRHENVIQYREGGWCSQERTSLEEMCAMITSDDPLISMFRANSKPISCPFNGASFTFTYNRGSGECAMPISLAEKCTDESKLLLKYQACPDVTGTESNTEELQCLASWNDGRNKYLVGTLKERNALGDAKIYRCFLYEEKSHHQGKMIYLLAQSGDSTCNGLTTVSEGSPTIKLIKVDKEHSRCKYPAWVTQHHDWHSLNGTRSYHFTNKNATLRVKMQAQNTDGETVHEEKIVCHNLEKSYPNDNMQGNKVKLVAHVTSGCDIGYVCMIFHKRDSHIIEIQQSDQKAIMPDEACSISDPSTMPYTTLITTFLHQRRCPNSGRYEILDFAPSHALSAVVSRRQQRSEQSRMTKRRTWPENIDDVECRSTDVQVGCTSPDQAEITIGNTCEHEKIAYSCHGSWEEKGMWYTIASQRNSEIPGGPGQTFCFSMLLEGVRDRGGRQKQQEKELWLSRPSRTCRERDAKDEWTYRLSNQGVCEDVMKASNAASAPSLSQLLFILHIAAYAAINTLCVLLSR